MTLRDPQGRPLIHLGLAKGLEAGSVGDLNSFTVFDNELRPRVHIGVDGEGSPFIQLLDADGNVTWSAL